MLEMAAGKRECDLDCPLILSKRKSERKINRFASIHLFILDVKQISAITIFHTFDF